LIATHPLVLGLFGLVLIGWTWHVLGQRSLARQAVLSPALFAFEIFDMQKVREYQQHRVAKSRVLNREPRSNAFAQICLDGVHRHAPSDLSRCGYDVGYRLFGFLTIRGLACFLPVVTLLPIWMVYTGGGAMLYIILSVLVASLQLSTARAPLPMGRRQRFAVNAIRLFALCAGMGLLTWLVTVGTNAVVPTLPTLHLHRHALSPHALATHGPLITLTLLPLAYGMAILIGKRPALILLCWIPLGGVGAFLAMQEAKLSPVLWLSMPVLALLLSLAAMRYHFLHRDLAA
jgi:hypothetical protein